MSVLAAIESVAGRLDPGDGVITGILAAELFPSERVYVCAFEGADGSRTWLVVDGDGEAIGDRRVIRDAVSVAALCEIAVDAAFPGDLEELRSHLLQVRMTEAPPGIEEAEAAALALERVVGAPPHLATMARLDEIGAAARRLELALDPTVPSPFTAAMQGAQGAVDDLVREVEGAYRLQLAAGPLP